MAECLVAVVTAGVNVAAAEAQTVRGIGSIDYFKVYSIKKQVFCNVCCSSSVQFCRQIEGDKFEIRQFRLSDLRKTFNM
jgi:hypothetical protein